MLFIVVSMRMMVILVSMFFMVVLILFVELKNGVGLRSIGNPLIFISESRMASISPGITVEFGSILWELVIIKGDSR